MPTDADSQKMLREIQAIVQQKLDEVEHIQFGMLTGRRLQVANHSSEQVRALITSQLVDIGARLGPHFLRETPAVALEQFALVAMARNEDSSGLLKSLINSFMVAYTAPETFSQALAHLERVEALRAQVAAMHKSLNSGHTQVLH